MGEEIICPEEQAASAIEELRVVKHPS